jgi:hypothetical protein
MIAPQPAQDRLAGIALRTLRPPLRTVRPAGAIFVSSVCKIINLSAEGLAALVGRIHSDDAQVRGVLKAANSAADSRRLASPAAM